MITKYIEAVNSFLPKIYHGKVKEVLTETIMGRLGSAEDEEEVKEVLFSIGYPAEAAAVFLKKQPPFFSSLTFLEYACITKRIVPIGGALLGIFLAVLKFEDLMRMNFQVLIGILMLVVFVCMLTATAMTVCFWHLEKYQILEKDSFGTDWEIEEILQEQVRPNHYQKLLSSRFRKRK